MIAENKMVSGYVVRQSSESPLRKIKRGKKYLLVSISLLWSSLIMFGLHLKNIQDINEVNIPVPKRIDGFALDRQHDDRSKLLLRNALQRSELTQSEMNSLNLDK